METGNGCAAATAWAKETAVRLSVGDGGGGSRQPGLRAVPTGARRVTAEGWGGRQASVGHRQPVS